MANTRVLTNKNYAWFVAPASAVTDIRAIDADEIDDFENISEAVKIDGTDYNTAASAQNDDRSFADAAGAQTAGYADASGAMALFKAKSTDTTSVFAIAQDAVRAAGADVIIIARPVLPVSTALAAGQEYNAWHVLTDAPSDQRGESSYSYTTQLLLQGDMAVRGVIAPADAVAPTVTVVDGSGTGAPGDIARLKAVYQGVNVTVGATWVSSDPDVATVTEHGIVQMIDDGTATITAQVPGSLASTGTTITVSSE